MQNRSRVITTAETSENSKRSLLFLLFSVVFLIGFFFFSVRESENTENSYSDLTDAVYTVADGLLQIDRTEEAASPEVDPYIEEAARLYIETHNAKYERQQ